MTELTDEQAAVYDRQIRVWGQDVQRRLTSARVLLLGCTPLAGEVAKNIVLAGVGHVTVIDDTPVEHLPPTFIVPAHGTALGTAAEAYAAGLQELNPMVTVAAAPGACNEAPSADMLRQYDIVLCFGLHAGQVARLNVRCRECSTKLMAGNARGGCAHVFLDLLDHGYRLTSSSEAKQVPQESVASYCSLHNALKMPWGSLSKPDQRQLHRLFGVWVIASTFEVEHDRAATADDFDTLRAAGHNHVVAQALPSKFFEEDALRDYLSSTAELAPVTAVVGGLMANDCVRCISRSGVCSKTVLLFTLADSTAQTHGLGFGDGERG